MTVTQTRLPETALPDGRTGLLVLGCLRLACARLSTPAAAAVPAVTASLRQMPESVNPPAAESDHLLGFRGRVRGVRVPGSHSLSDTVIRGSAASEPEQLAAILRVAARLTRPPPMRNSIEGIYYSVSRPRRPYRRAALQLGKTRSLQPHDPAPVYPGSGLFS